PQPAGLSDQPCPDMSVEDGLKPQTIKVYRSVCHAFPQVTEYGGWAARTEHDTGNAIDVMVYGNKELGDQIADWAQAHAAELDLYDLIWYDRIWTPVRSSEGWRDYGDHGSATANHMDHVHIGTN
ncbi:mucin-2 protein, partial [Nocardioides sp. CER28]